MRKTLNFAICLILLISLIPTMTNTPISTHAQGDLFGAQWFREGIMYEVFVRSFRDSNGDGIGDIQGVIDGLDYIQSLGANIIWLMPIHASPSYHGYDITDYYAINPDYGTLDDVLRLIEEVHQRDMYIIMDYVANHTSNRHPFFLDAFANPESEYSEFYKWINEEQTQVQGFSGISSMPEINYQSDFARQYMVDMAQFWMDPNGDGDTTDGFDGFRCDVAVGPPLSFWADLRTAMRDKNPDSILLAEAWLRSGLELRDYVQGDGFNAIFDFPTFHSLIADHHTNNDGTVSGASSGDFMEIAVNGAQRLYPDGTHLVRFINNHDTNRIMSEVEGDVARARAAAVWLMTAPGTPMLYYGEEIGMFGSRGTAPYYDEPRREPLDWYANENGPIRTTWYAPDQRYNAPNDGISIEEQEGDPASLLNHYRILAQLRHATPELHNGGVGKLDISSEGIDLYAMWRGEETAPIMIIINFQVEPVSASFTGTVPTEIVLGEGFTLDGNSFTIEPAGYAILR